MNKSMVVGFTLFFLVSSSILQFSDACAANSASRLTRTEAAINSVKSDLRAVIEECWNYTAWRLIVNAVLMHASAKKNPVRLPELSRPLPDPKVHVRRPSLDESISLACAARMTQPNNVVWKHNGHLLTAQQTGGDLQYSRTGGNTLILHNVTYAAWGKFECLQRCQSDGMESWCPMGEHWVFPKPTTRYHEVFAQRMPRIIVPRYMPFSVTCQLDFPCGPDPLQHFIWRYDGVFLAWPAGHYLQQTSCIDTHRHTLMIHTNTSEITGTDGRPHCASTLTLHVPWPEHTGSQLECWARSDTTQQLWYVHPTSVQFNGSLPFPG
ncbi:uncharacterized protein LOC129589833 [Paramacrobiotus metropolitanus]|uniref:uncharacterized protein LOC129589833 n=1 Tax=Paramacrobiotus metropolitanus TaxID=2943436 RepID=UPI002445A94D|nr:uncharacterized protein LOC129589833 [Paramacrobiotus metropolitanus]